MVKESVDNDVWYSVVKRLPTQVRIRILKVLPEDFHQKSIAQVCSVTPLVVSNWTHKDCSSPEAEIFTHFNELKTSTLPPFPIPPEDELTLVPRSLLPDLD